MVPKVPIATENWLFWPQIQPQNVAVARAYISDLFQKKCRRMIAQFEGGRTGKKGNIILPIYLCNNKHLGCVSDRLCLGNIMLSNKDCMKKLLLDTFLWPNLLNSQLLFWKSNFIFGMPKVFMVQKVKFSSEKLFLTFSKRNYISKTLIGNSEV